MYTTDYNYCLKYAVYFIYYMYTHLPIAYICTYIYICI